MTAARSEVVTLLAGIDPWASSRAGQLTRCDGQPLTPEQATLAASATEEEFATARLPDCDHVTCDIRGEPCRYAAAGKLTGLEPWPPRSADDTADLPDDALLAAWVRHAVEQDDIRAYETLAWDLRHRWGLDKAGSLARDVGDACDGYVTHSPDAMRLENLLGWEQAVLFAAWFRANGNDA